MGQGNSFYFVCPNRAEALRPATAEVGVQTEDLIEIPERPVQISQSSALSVAARQRALHIAVRQRPEIYARLYQRDDLRIPLHVRFPILANARGISNPYAQWWGRPGRPGYFRRIVRRVIFLLKLRSYGAHLQHLCQRAQRRSPIQRYFLWHHLIRDRHGVLQYL